MLLDETVTPSRAFQRLITRCEKKCFLTSWLTQFGQVSMCAIISGRELTFTFAICYRRSVCLSSVLL